MPLTSDSVNDALDYATATSSSRVPESAGMSLRNRLWKRY